MFLGFYRAKKIVLAKYKMNCRVRAHLARVAYEHLKSSSRQFDDWSHDHDAVVSLLFYTILIYAHLIFQNAKYVTRIYTDVIKFSFCRCRLVRRLIINIRVVSIEPVLTIRTTQRIQHF